jgi:hypothetical protein
MFTTWYGRARLRRGPTFIAAAAAAALLVVAVTSPAGAIAATEPSPAAPCNVGPRTPFSLTLDALTAPLGTELALTVASESAQCGAPDTLKQVQIKTYDLDGVLADVRNQGDIAAEDGHAVIASIAARRGYRVEVQALIETEDTVRTHVLDASTIVRTEFEVTPQNVLVPSMAGYGGQFNQYLYTAFSAVPADQFASVEQKVVDLQPQFVRIFFQRDAFTNPDRMQSFIRTVELAQRTGTTINITWQGTFQPALQAEYPKFAAVLVDLVKNRGITNLRWVTPQNEVNTTAISQATYEWMARLLAAKLAEAGLDQQVRIMGGDLVESNQTAWFTYMTEHMSDVLDAYSIHIYWDYWDTPKLERRLTQVRAIWDGLPEAGKKPLYVTEFAVRGIKNWNGQAFDPGVWSDGTQITETNVSAFQHTWFSLLAARLGYRSAVKWDSYYAKYGPTDRKVYWMIGPWWDNWPRYPVYWTTRLLTLTMRPGWRSVEVAGESGQKLLTGFVGPSGELTVLGLNRAGGQLNEAVADASWYSIAGLPPGTTMHLVRWNEDGGGDLSDGGPVPVDADGVAHVRAPLQSAFSLTTLPVTVA